MRMDSKGLSPAIATILLVALTVVAVGTIAAFVSRTSPGTPPASAAIRLSQVPDANGGYDNVTVIHNGGDDIEVTNLIVRSSASTVDINVWENPSPLECGDVLSAGESCTVNITGITPAVADGDVISLIFAPSGQILATETVGISTA